MNVFPSIWMAYDKEYARQYYLANQKKKIKQQRERYNKDPVKHRKARKDIHQKLRREVLNAYGGKCCCPNCAESRPEFLAIDHIHGGGRKHRIEIGARGARFYYWLKRQGFPKDDFRILCHNCNQSKGLYGYCPHEKEWV